MQNTWQLNWYTTELLGHKDISMTMRYSHLSQAHKTKAINLLNGLTGNLTEKSQTFEAEKKDMSEKSQIFQM